ncbi:NAD(P)H-hydrate dehydratase [Sanguibacter sp. 25GB23B1]|uniref:bifunctional ADP-dependent NAD(P)H-hydrate dehydratase/NAD(P)H-hydrate epimerase n=1 Tax=unclassified Sanguibacter TaxID=2645534 RepID=UPI0032AFEAA3
MIVAHDSRTVRSAEAPLLAAGVPLMDRAAFALAGVVVREIRARRGRVRGSTVVALVGPGNNGGDALFAGARLAGRGIQVTAVLTSERVHEAGLAALLAAGGRRVSLVAGLAGPDAPPRTPGVAVSAAARLVQDADVVLDALLGLGGTGGLRGAARDLVTAVLHPPVRPDGRGPLVVAVDLPSGIGVDDGSVPGVVLPADVTVTFGATKPGLLLPPAAELAGRVEAVDIGLALDAVDGSAQERPVLRRLSARDLVDQHLLAPPGAAVHKYTRGVVGVVAGTEQYPGAALLTVSGAIRTGTGMVRYLGARDVTSAVLAARPEAVPAGGRVQAWALGPGISTAPPATDDATRAQQGRIRHALAHATGELSSDVVGARVPAVVDAGALALLPRTCPPWIVLTPHAGELAELLRARGETVERPDVEAEPLRWAQRARELTGATVLLKGGVTLVVGPGCVYSQADGPAWLATAGAGDVLTGVLAALLAAHSAAAVKDPSLPARLAAAAALVHGLAAHRANPGGPVSALDVADALPGTVAHLLREHAVEE